MSAAPLAARNVSKHFGGTRRLLGRRRPAVRAVHGVTLELAAGGTLGLVGESGSGKTTLGRLLAGLGEPTAGRVEWHGHDIADLDPGGRRDFRKRVQYVFQDPASSLNPRRRVGRIIGAPLEVLLGMARDAREVRVAELMGLVGLREEFVDRYPHEFSGGQGQRIVIARALAAEPDVLILDEPTSALDVSIQAQILELLRELQERLGLTYLFISHDLAVVEQLCEEVAVMRAGAIVERGARAPLFASPQHPYTRELLAAVPVPP
jgi:peptide/nickel transport system ATP-binding protein